MGRHRILVISAVCALALVCCQLAVAAASPDGLVLTPAQVGAGYRLKARTDSHCLAACVTLDLCGYPFATERLRTSRLQLDYARTGQPEVSNEVVTYRKGGGKSALRELARAVATCPNTPVASPVKGVPPLTFRLKRIAVSKLVPGAIALEVHVSGTYKGKPVSQTSFTIYQVRGDTLSAVYVVPRPANTLARAERIARRAADAAASNLRRTIS